MIAKTVFSMKTATKTLAGFAITLIVAVVVGYAGCDGIVHVREHAEEIGVVRLPSVVGLAKLRDGQTSVGYALRGLINPLTVGREFRETQYELVDEGMKSFRAGIDLYEPLPQTPEEAIAWRETRPVLDRWAAGIPELLQIEHERDRLLAGGTAMDDPNMKALNDRALKAASGIRAAMLESNRGLDRVFDINVQVGNDALVEARQASKSAGTFMVAAILIGVLLLALTGWFLARSIARTLMTLISEANRLTEAAMAGKLDTRADPDLVTAEFRPIITGMNQTLDAVLVPLDLSAKYVARIAEGDIPPKITDSYRGEFNTIKENLNTCIDAVNAMIADTRTLAEAAVSGKLSVRADASKHQGDFRTIVQGINNTLDAVIGPLNATAKHVDAIAKGAIPEKITDDFAGDFSLIKENLNRCIDAIGLLVKDADMLGAAAVEGRLGTRADASKHQGDFRKVVEGVNRTLDAVLAPINEASQVLEKLAQRDLRARMLGEYQGDHAKIKQSLNQTGQSLHDALGQVAAAVDQVSSAAGQIASSSQAVADGASQQASSLEETSSSLESMSSMAKRSADNAQQANALAQMAEMAAKGGATAVEQMTVSMGKIKVSAEGTSQIIKDINEIAFQTNLLALNAAVEAARAGEAGRGFAVVAEEVRSLALRSKEAAMKTEELIKESVRQAGEGEVTAKQVSSKLADILGGIDKVSGIVTEISASAKEQATGVDQVSSAVADMNKVTQQNAASSEESSSAAAELSSQAEELAAMVGAFQFSKTMTARPVTVRPSSASPSRQRRPATPVAQARPEKVIPLEQDPAFRDF
jgi:methyl-accepting chemotaxis protein